MDPGDPVKTYSLMLSAIRIVFSAVALVILLNCSRDSGSQIRVELRDIPESKATSQTAPKTDSLCPVGDLPDTNIQTAPSKNHSVKLSWNLSASSNGPDGKNIGYCLYRSEGGPVQKSSAQSMFPCERCQRVTKTPVQGTTTDPDRNVEDGAHYCYVAVAIDIRNGKLSGFSNQADAVLPPSTDRPFCTALISTKQADRKKPRGRR
jgi:hypothetical protein